MADIFGTSANETIIGSALDDTIYSGPTNDPNATGTGSDIILSGAGNDTVFGQDGNDILYGGSTNSPGEVETGDDSLNGGVGGDQLHGGDGDDMLDGGDGDDLLFGHSGANALNGGAGNDTLTSTGLNDVLDGGTVGELGSLGDLAFLDRAAFAAMLSLSLDAATGGIQQGLGDGTSVTNIERLDFTGGAGNDVIAGLTAGTYADTLRAGAGADTLQGGGGGDTLFGGSDNDTLEGGAGTDLLYGGSSNNSSEAGTGDDLLRGGDGSDQLFGQDGADHLFGDAASDNLHGGAGNDTIDGGDSGDQISGGNVFSDDTGTGNDNLSGGLGADQLYGGDGDDTLAGGADGDQLFGHGGNDILDGGVGNDSIDAGAGNDTITSDAGVDAIIGGTDSGAGDFARIDRSNLPTANLTLNINSGSTNIGDGTLSSGTSVQGIERIEIRGGGGNDSFAGGALGDTLVGNGGNDTLVGNAGDDILDGGAGTNLLYGGANNDTLDGAAGSTTTIVYDGARSDFQVSQLPAGRIQILDLRPGSPNGTDNAGGISFVQFSDGTFAPALIPPSGSDGTASTDEDTARALTVADFGFADSNAGDALGAVRVDTLPAAGTLTLSSVAVTAGQVVTRADLDAGKLVFTPAANANGAAYGSFTFSVADQTNTFDLTTNTLTLDVTAVNDAPVITSGGGGVTATASVAENTSDVTTLTAMDIEAPPQTLTFSIAGGMDAALFAVNASSGALSFIAAPDVEWPADSGADNIYDVSIQVSDGSLIDTQTLSVTVIDVNEFDVIPPADSDGTADRVAENPADGAVVGVTAFALDSDATTSAITYFLADTAGGRFAIDASTGVVTVAAGLLFDREAVSLHTFTVGAVSEDGSSNQSSFTIELIDVDEFDVGALADTDGAADQVAENAASGTVVGVAASAADADATTNAITYMLTDDSGGRFAVHASTGVVTVADGSLLDRELAPAHGITIRATSQDGSFTDRAFSIALTDANEFNVGAIEDANSAPDQVEENAANGTVVGVMAAASDADATTNAVTYSLTGSAGGRFAIDATTGVLTVANGALLDFEAAISHDIAVRASSDDGSSSDRTFTIGVTDVAEGGGNQAPIITSNGAGASATISVAENSTVVTTVVASDADDPRQTLTYSIVGGADASSFALDGSTGALVFVAAPDFENPVDAGADSGYAVTVGVSDGSGGVDAQAIAVTVTNVPGLILTGTKMNNALAGGIEEDTISGLAGNDTLTAAQATTRCPAARARTS